MIVRILEELNIKIDRTPSLYDDVMKAFADYRLPGEIDHTKRVVDKCRELACQFGIDQEAAATAGALHDISALIPNDRRIHACRLADIELLEEEQRFPLLTHQKISRQIAREIFSVKDPAVLEAVACHTTLKKDASALDLVLFVADKLEWDQEGTPPYRDRVIRKLELSLESAALVYINYLFSHEHRLKVVHPRLRDAREDLVNRTAASAAGIPPRSYL